KNIKHGNSLISGTDQELEKYFGKNYRDKKPFNWKEEFPDVFEQHGFDVIIGNPPYVFGGNYGIQNEDKEYFKETFISGSGKINLFTIFIEKSIKLLKNTGQLSFIIPNTFLRVTSYEKTREYILRNTHIRQIVDVGTDVFSGAVTSSIILLLEKQSQANLESLGVGIKMGVAGQMTKIKQSEFDKNNYIFNIGSDPLELQLLNKLSTNSILLGELCSELIFGVVITKNRDKLVSNFQKPGFKSFLEGRDIGRYYISPIKKY
ncbi:MAG: Eco57I restriction-modification methylase domain-containing protein, partial [bacterium]|nr:Eco57I restriction-modification methylase domain-containing protein [bacterium]